MRKILKYLFSILSCAILCGCPASSIYSYKLIGFENEKDYYPLNLNSEIVYARVRAMREYSNDNKSFIIFNFEKPYSEKVEIYSKNFGQLKNELNDNRYYSLEIKNIENIKKDTVYINISDKIYKFYHD